MQWDRRSLMLLLGLAVSAPALSAGGKKLKTPKAPAIPPKDGIEVLGLIPPTGPPVARLLSTMHYSQHYLYVEHEAGAGITLIDTTNVKQPSVLADKLSISTGDPSNLFVVVGTAVLTTGQPALPVPATRPQTITIMDCSDPAHSAIVREFKDVTAIGRDDARALIFLANAEGIWILKQNRAEDPRIEEEYARRVLYGG